MFTHVVVQTTQPQRMKIGRYSKKLNALMLPSVKIEGVNMTRSTSIYSGKLKGISKLLTILLNLPSNALIG